jgi:hypothetical protein
MVAGLGLFETISAEMYRQELLRMDKNVASVTARDLKAHLESLSGPLRKLATNEAIPRLIQRRDTNQLSTLFRSASEEQAPPSLNATVVNWVLMDARGQTLVRYPESNNPKTDPSERHYFTNTLGLRSDGVSYSGVYRSTEDGNYKFGISGVIFSDGPAPERLGVLTMMINTGSANTRLGTRYEGQEIVLLAPGDPADQEPKLRAIRPGEYFIFLHPALTNGEAVFGPIAMNTSRSGFVWYRDPVGHKKAAFGGFWLAATAPVPGTPYLVMVQSRARLWHVYSVAAVILNALGSVMVVGARQLRERKKRCAAPNSARPLQHGSS